MAINKGGYVKRYIEERSCNRFYSGKAINIKCSEGVCVNLRIQHQMSLRHIVIRGLVGLYNIFRYYPIKARFSKKKVIEPKMCASILSTTLSETFLILLRNE